MELEYQRPQTNHKVISVIISAYVVLGRLGRLVSRLRLRGIWSLAYGIRWAVLLQPCGSLQKSGP